MVQTPNLIDLGLLLLLAIFLVRAMVRGFIREIAGLLGLVAAVYLSVIFYQQAADLVGGMSGMNQAWLPAACFVGILIITLCVFIYLGHGLSQLILAGPLSFMDRILGACLGVVKGILVSYLVLRAVLIMMPAQLPAALSESMLSPFVLKSGNYLLDMVPQSWTDHLREKSRSLTQSPSTAPTQQQ